MRAMFELSCCTVQHSSSFLLTAAAAKSENAETEESDGATDDPVSKFFCLDTEGQNASLNEDIAPLPDNALGIKLPENDAVS